MLKSPELARAAKTRLHFIKSQHHIVLGAPGTQLLDVLHGGKIRPNALIAFHDHTGNLRGFHAALFDAIEETLKAAVRLPITVRERHVDDGLIEIHDPAFLAGHPACLLTGQGSAMIAAIEADDADLLPSAHLDAVCAGKFDRALRSFRTAAKQKDFLQSSRGNAGNQFRQSWPLLTGEDVVVNEAAVDLINDGLAHFRHAMPAIGHQHAAAPVQPAVTVLVIDEDVFRPIPNNGRHPAHGQGLETTTTLNVLKGIRMRHLSADGAVFGGDVRNSLGGGVKFFAHG